MTFQIGDLLYHFVSLILEGAPFILIGAIISGLLDAYLPFRAIDRALPKSPVGAILFAGLLGAVFPVCECAIVPVIRRLVAKGLPVAVALTYMLASPIVNPLTAFSTWSAFPGRGAEDQLPWLMMGFRTLVGYAIAVIVGGILSRFQPTTLLQPTVMDSVAKAKANLSMPSVAAPKADKEGRRLVQAMRTAQKDFVDVAMYFCIGVLIAGFFKTHLQYQANLQETIYWLAQNAWLAPLILMALAFVLSLCSTTDAFIIASDSLFGNTAKLAFLVFGPMMDVKLIFLYSTVIKPRVVFCLAIGLALLTWLMVRALDGYWA